jgi:hypothetical protein
VPKWQTLQGLQESSGWQHLLQLSCPVLRLLLPLTAFTAANWDCFAVSKAAVHQCTRSKGSGVKGFPPCTSHDMMPAVAHAACLNLIVPCVLPCPACCCHSSTKSLRVSMEPMEAASRVSGALQHCISNAFQTPIKCIPYAAQMQPPVPPSSPARVCCVL